MRVHILGPLEVIDGNNAIPLGGPKQRAVLAHLTLRANSFVSAELLIDEVWGDDPPPAARSSLHSYISRLRTTLGEARLEGGSRGYVLRVASEEVDALRFEAFVERSRKLAATDPAAAVRTYQEGLGLWRGPALDDLSDQASLQPEIARLEELRMAATEEWISAELDLGRHAELVPDLETLVGSHPLRERLWGHLMVALYRSGRQADALASYQRARELLSEELGIDPSPELRRLQGQILRQDVALEVAGETLRGYRLLEQIGEGAFGAVHRAFQPQVGREVAVKVVHPRFAHDPEFIRRFEAEAQVVARLEHPHVVPLYDFWREPEGAYLVMRYLRGGSLRETLAEGPLGPPEAARLLDQVASALGAAHRQGVVHRDVKPANILFDEDTNAYLSDFGIAKELASADVARAGGSPSPLAYYLSPEEIRGEPATPATDIYSLGVVLYEALAGHHPFAESPPEEVMGRHLREPLPPVGFVRSDLPAAVDEVIARATAKDPTERYPEVPAMVAAFAEALDPASTRPGPVSGIDARNPYKGLRPFLEADAGDFFGREALVTELVDRLADIGEGSRFLAVVGPSGSGKSSVVRAGLLPELRRGALGGSEGWFIVEMHPGVRPFEELAAALMRIATDPVPGLVERLERDDAELLRAADEILPHGIELLLVIDQFEELFTLVGDQDTRSRFLRLLHTTATDPGSRLRVVLTLRADFYDRPLSYGGLAQLVKARTVTVTPLSPEELERTVSGPANAVGVEVEPPLVAEIVADCSEQPGALPLLQYALTELFDRRSDGALTLDGYQGIGGVSGALGRRAEDLYGRMNRSGREAARQLFLRLLVLGEEGSEDTRRRVLRAELSSLEVDREAMEAVIDTFGARRLLSFDRDPLTRGPTVEVAHEALLREWGRLRRWIESAREDVRSHRRLAAASREWIESGRDPSFLLRGAHLSRFEDWTATSGLALTTDERTYLEASLAEREADRLEEEARAVRERGLERRAFRRLRALVAVLAAAAIVASGLTLFAFSQRGRAAREATRAEREARVATARELAAAAVANLDVDPERSILLALEAVDATWETDGTVLPEAQETLHRAVKRWRLVRTFAHGGWGLGVTSDGTRFATGGSNSTDNTATVWDTESGEDLLVLTGPAVGRLAAAFSPDGRLIATTHNDGTAWLWNAATGERLHVLRGHEGYLGHPAFSPDSRWLATGAEDATVRIWDVARGAEEMTLTGHTAEIISVAFSPDGSRVASAGGDKTARIWDLDTGETAVTLAGHEWPLLDVAFSPDGSRIATASNDGSARIWDAESGTQLRTFAAPVPVNATAFSPDGTRIAGGGTDGVVRVWDAVTGEELLTLAAHRSQVGNVAFTPDGDQLLTTGLDGTTRLWDMSVAGGRDWLTVPAAQDIFTGVAFSPDGKRFAAPAEPSGVTIWNAHSGDEVITLTGHDRKLTTVAFSPEGDRLAASSDLTTDPPVWDVETGRLIVKLKGHTRPARAIAFSPDGALLVTGSFDATARVWDAATGDQLGVLRPGGEVFSAAFSPEGRFVITGEGGGAVTVWDAASLEEVRTLRGHTNAVAGLAFGPDGMFVTASEDGTAKVWDFDSGEERLTFRGHNALLNQVAVSPDGTRAATASDDRTTKLWDPTTGRELLTLFGHDDLVFGVDFSPDGRLLATASPDGTVALHLLPIEEFRELARERVTRSLTDEECRQYLHVERCAQK